MYCVHFILQYYYKAVFQCVDPFVLYISRHKHTIWAIILLYKKYDKTELGLRTITTSTDVTVGKFFPVHAMKGCGGEEVWLP